MFTMVCIFYTDLSLSLSIQLLLSLSSQSKCFHLGSVVNLILGLTFLLKSINDRFVFPSSFVGETCDLAIFTTRFQLQHSQCRWNHHSLLFVVWGGNAVEDLQSIECFHSTFGFVWDHSSDNFEETLARCTEMVRTSRRFCVHTFTKVIKNLEFVTIEVTRDADLITTYHNDTLTTQKLFCDDRSKTTHQMVSTIDENNFLKTHCGGVGYLVPLISVTICSLIFFICPM